MFKFKNWSKRKKIIVGIIVIIIIGIGSNQTETDSITKTNFSDDSSKDNLFVEFQLNKSDSIFTNDDLTYLIKTFGEPIEIRTPEDSKKFGYINKYSFWSPFFNKDESLEIIEEYNSNYEQYRLEQQKWLRKTGPLSSQNRNWESYKLKMNKFSDRYKNFYIEKSKGEELQLYKIIESYMKKNPEKSYAIVLEEFEDFFRLDDNGYRTGINVYKLTNTVYTFKTQEKVSLLKYYRDNTNRKDFEIDEFRTLKVTGNGIILNDSDYNSSFCITDQSRSEIKKLLTEGTGDWILGQKGNVQGSYKFSNNGEYRMTNIYSPKVNGLPQPTIGDWWINCSGEIVCSKQQDEMIITKSGILNGQTLYTKYN